MSLEHIAELYPEVWAAWSTGLDVRRGGGETYAELAARIERAVARIAARWRACVDPRRVPRRRDQELRRENPRRECGGSGRLPAWVTAGLQPSSTASTTRRTCGSTRGMTPHTSKGCSRPSGRTDRGARGGQPTTSLRAPALEQDVRAPGSVPITTPRLELRMLDHVSHEDLRRRRVGGSGSLCRRERAPFVARGGDGHGGGGPTDGLAARGPIVELAHDIRREARWRRFDARPDPRTGCSPARGSVSSAMRRLRRGDEDRRRRPREGRGPRG